MNDFKEMKEKLKKLYLYLSKSKNASKVILYLMLFNTLVCIEVLFYTENMFELLRGITICIFFLGFYVYSDITLRKK